MAIGPISDLTPEGVGPRGYLPSLRWRARRWWSLLPPQSRFYSRGVRYRSARASAVLWGMAAVVPFSLLIGFGVVLGYGADQLGWNRPFESLASTATKAAVAPIVVFVIALILTWWCRLARLAWLTWKPGQIAVADFTKGSELTGVTETQLTSQFRNRLAVLRLQSATPTPGAAPVGPFADVLDPAGFSSGDFLKSLVTLLRVGFPSRAIEIQGMVRERENDPARYGVAVQAVLLRGATSPILEVWETTWERALKTAADGITAAILPRTRACRGPWAAWRGYAMPAELLSAYEEAAEHEQKGRYDAALERYLAALKLDPTNVQVRLHLAQLEEKLGLFLKALASYQSIHALSHPGSENLPRGLYRRGARREWDRAQQIAKYRELVMLGEGSIIAQWSATARGEKLPEATRASLREEFEKRLRPLTIPRGDPVADAISCAILTLLEADRSLSAAAERELTCRLGRWAYRGSEALRCSLPGTLLRPRDYPLTRTTVGLSMACIRRRYELAAGADLVDDDRRPVKPTIGLAQRLERQIAWAHWRRGPWKAHWTPPQLRRRRWHEHYNAACLYSIALIPTYARSLPRPCYKELAERAVRHLELATATAESSFVDTRRDWVLERDHDLIGLRQRWQFEAFASVYFPDEAPTRRVVVPYPRLAESRYTRTLLATLARSWHDVWHARAAAPWDVHLALDWYAEELELWTLIAAVAQHDFDWRQRHRLYERSARLLIKNRCNPPEVSFRSSLNGSAVVPAPSRSRPSSEMKLHRRRVSGLATLLERHYGATDWAYLNAWLKLLRYYDAEPLPELSAEQVKILCERQAAVWQALSDWMVGADRATQAYIAFKEGLTRAAQVRIDTEQEVLAA